jgi:hypothetical protein
MTSLLPVFNLGCEAEEDFIILGQRLRNTVNSSVFVMLKFVLTGFP